MVPEGWRRITLGDLTSESAFGPRFSSDLYDKNGTVGTIRTTDLDDEGNINYSTIPYANLSDSFKNHFLNEGDLLITRSGSCGIPCVFKTQEKPIVAGAFLIRFRLNQNVNSAFLHALLKSEKLQVRIQNLASGGVQKNLTGTNLKKLDFVIPPLPEQKKIAQILSTWDKAISTTEQLLANSRKQKKALMQQLLTGKKRLLDNNGTPFTGEWKSETIASISRSFSGGTPSRNNKDYFGGNIPWITSGKLNDRFISSVDEYITEAGLNNSSAKQISENCILVAMYGATAGKVAINKIQGATINQAILAIHPNSTFDKIFIFYLIEDQMKKTISLVQGGQPNLNASIIKGVKLKLPALEEQQKIATVLSNVDKEIETLQQKLNCLKQEKKALMQQLLTGKRRVKF